MKGIVLAGGLGTRLYPGTRVVNKHLFLIYDKPMIYYPIQTLVNMGIEDVLVVTGGYSASDFSRLLGNGRDFGLKRLSYAYQDGEGGIAEALGLTEEFMDHDSMCVVLGDNILEKNIKCPDIPEGTARIFLKKVKDPSRYGIAEIQDGSIISLEEKPEEPKSNLAVIGVYMYDTEVYNIIKTLKPSGRGELEITDVNKEYLRRNKLEYGMIDGWWIDAGTFTSMWLASGLVRVYGANNP